MTVNIDIIKVDLIESLNELKHQYLEDVTAPLDGMWLLGFLPLSNHFGFYKNKSLIGFCCINHEGYLLQFYLLPAHQMNASSLFSSILFSNSLITGKVNGAYASTAEPVYLSQCLDNFPIVNVESLMYQQRAMQLNEDKLAIEMPLITLSQLEIVVAFAVSSIGAPKEWLTDYYTNLIERKELFGYWKSDQLLAAGECRKRDDYQTAYADLGIIVATSERGKGIATKVLKYLMTIAQRKNLQPICSTEKDNVAAQKAINRVGFFAHNRIVKFEL